MPTILASLVARQNYCNDGYYDDNCYYYSPWWVYGRWILFGAIILAAFLLFCIFSRISARRRRQRGVQPFRGTGWAAPPAYGAGGYATQQPGGGYYGQPQPQGNWQGPPPPQYGAPDGSHFGKGGNAPGPAPYGQQSGSVELQSPAHAYQRDAPGDHVYQPPPGPPPGKGDGIVR